MQPTSHLTNPCLSAPARYHAPGDHGPNQLRPKARSLGLRAMCLPHVPSPPLQLYEPKRNRLHHRIYAAAHAKFAVNAFKIRLDGTP